MAFYIALIFFFASVLDLSDAQSDQCVNDTAVIAPASNETLSQFPNPAEECAKKFQAGIYECSVDGFSYIDEITGACEDLGGILFVGNVFLNCEIPLPGNSTTEPFSFTWDIQNYSNCLGESCTESDWKAFNDLVFGQFNKELEAYGGSCQTSIEYTQGGTPAATLPVETTSSPGATASPTTNPVASPSATPTTASPGSPTVEPSVNLNGTSPSSTPMTVSPGSPTVEPSANKNGIPSEPSPPSDAPVSTPAPTSSTVTVGLSRHIFSTIGVASWIFVFV